MLLQTFKLAAHIKPPVKIGGFIIFTVSMVLTYTKLQTILFMQFTYDL